MQIKVAVLLSYYNGDEFVDEQLTSLFAQNLGNEFVVDVYIRDDGSTDIFSLDYLNIVKNKFTSVRIVNGVNLGVAQSFMQLLTDVDGYDYYAFCDQDDYWYADKIALGCSSIANNKGAALYCSSYDLVGKNLESLPMKRGSTVPTFYNAMFKNFCTGCTCIINSALRDELIIVNDKYELPKNVMHDWWFLLVAYSTGVVFFDPKPSLMYRQHGNNVIGGVESFTGRLLRYGKGIIKFRRVRSRLAEMLLDKFTMKMPKEYRFFLEDIVSSNVSFRARIRLIVKNNVGYFNMLDTISVKILMLIARY